MVNKKTKKERSEKIDRVMEILRSISQTTIIPRNIRRTADSAKEALRDESITIGVRAANAVSILEGILHDPNMPSFARVKIWNAISELETVRDT
jgi:uncharacterized protein (UPF0147 family)